MNQLDDSPLAQRLVALFLPMPAALTLRVLSRASDKPRRVRPRRPLWATVTLAATLTIAAVMGVS